MVKYLSGQKVIQGRIDALQREMDALTSVSPVYDVEKGSTYANGLVALRQAYADGKAGLQPLFVKSDGSSVVRPMTFEETIDAVVNAFESGNRELLDNWNDSCTGIAYKKGTSLFKVVPVSSDLILLNAQFAQAYVSVGYDTQEGVELDKNKGKYNVPLTKPEYLENPGWCAAVPDKALREAFGDIVFAERKTKAGMGFYVRDDPTEDLLRALAVNYLYSSSSAYDLNYLYLYARFVRGSPK
ncbi:MAG: hypothetical protein ABII01_05725 [Candidatus Woesearchaeota archaeon]